MNKTLHLKPKARPLALLPASIFGCKLRSLIFVLLCALGIPTALRAATVKQTIDGLEYTINTDDKTASVRQTDTSLSSAIIKEKVTYMDEIYLVTKVEAEGFMNSQIASVLLPQFITTIGENAFYGCQKLTEITIPEKTSNIARHAFYNCRRLTKVIWNAVECKYTSNWELFSPYVTEITFGNNVKSIPQYSFSDLKSLTKVIFSTSIEKIEHDAFSNCTSLTEIVIPDNIKIIEGNAFKGCNGITSISLGSNLNSLGEQSFYGTSISEITIPENVKYLGADIFYACRNLRTVYYNAIDANADEGSPFYSSSSNLEEVYIGDSVKKIPQECFAFLPKLKKIHWGDSLEVIGNYAFYGNSSLEDFEFPSSIKEIQGGAFGKCESLSKIIIPKSVFNLSIGAFSECSNLKILKVESRLINKEAFRNCTNLEKICLISDELREKVFANCKKIHTIYSLSEFPPMAKSDTFSNYEGVIVYVPIGSLDEYRNDDVWKNFSDIRESDFADLDETFWKDDVVEPDPLPETLTVDGIIYSLDNTEMTATVTGFNQDILNIVIPSQISYQEYSYTVNKIGDWAFSYSDIESVSLPETVNEIQQYAFYSCNNLKEFTLGENVASIGALAVGYCQNLNTLNYNAISCIDPDNLNPFAGSDIQILNIGDNVKVIPQTFFRGLPVENLTIPDSVEKISTWAFYECENLKTVVIGTNVKKMDEAFVSNSNLEKVTFNAINCADFEVTPFPTTVKEITFGDKVERIPGYVCEGWTEITKVDFPESLKEIGKFAFNKVNGITELTIPENVTAVHDMAFMNCSNLRTLYYNAIDCPEIGEEMYVFNPTITDIQFGDKVKCIPAWGFVSQNVENIIIPDGVTEISHNAFYLCSRLKDVTIGKGVRHIDDGAFNGCSQISSVHFNAIDCEDLLIYDDDETIRSNGFFPNVTEASIGDEVKRIPGGLLALNESLNEIEIPASVKEIGAYAFTGCRGLQSVVINNIPDWTQVSLRHEDSNPINYAHSFMVKGDDKPMVNLNIKDIDVINPGVFIGAQNLKTVRITGNRVIDINAFTYCSGITDICIETQELGDFAFGVYRQGLNVYSLTMTPPGYGEDSFYTTVDDISLRDVNLYVPVGSKDAYMADPFWSQMNIMESDMKDLDSIFDPENRNVWVDVLFNPDEEVYFNLNGVRVDSKHLAPGTYVRILNGKSTKILVK